MSRRGARPAARHAAAGGLALLGAAVLAFPARSESRYSLRGDGEAVPAMRADARALGGAEAASSSPTVSGNPAALLFAGRTLFYGTYDTEWVRTEENLPGGHRVRKEYAGLVPNLALVFPLGERAAVGTGLLVARRTGGRIEQAAAVDDGDGGTISYRQVFEASGNLLRIPFLVAVETHGVQLGAGADLLLLASDLRWRNDFPSAAEGRGFVDSDDRDETSLSGVAGRAGLRVPLGRRLALGGWVSIPSRLSGERRLESSQAGTPGDRTIETALDVAPIWAVGLEGKPREGIRWLADWVHEAWERADPLSPVDRFVDVDRLALGIEWSPADRRRGVKMPLRAGYRTERLATRDASGRTVREHLFTAGSGIGLAGGRGSIDWYVEAGWRGRKDETEYREHLVRFGVTLTGWERWTRRRPPVEDDDW